MAAIRTVLNHSPAEPPGASSPSVAGYVAGTQSLDWAAFESSLPKPDFLRKILNSLVTSHAGTPARLRALTGGDDLEVLGHIAHTLRGLAATIFAPHVELAARSLEDSIRNNRRVDDGLLNDLATALDRLLAEVQHRLVSLQTL